MNMTGYLTKKDWEEITKRIEACVERVLQRHGYPKTHTVYSDPVTKKVTVQCQCGINYTLIGSDLVKK